MGEIELDSFFEDFLTKESLFKDKKVLQSNYQPETIKHRDNEIRSVANVLAPALKFEKPSNIFIYGKTGTGKTLCIKHIIKNINQAALKQNLNLKFVYINCKLKRIADTEYRLIAQIIREFGTEIPATGLPTDEVYKIFYNLLCKEKLLVILVLDEVDQLIKKTGDGILYNLTRINEELLHSMVTLVGISNDLMFIESVDPRVKSSLSEEEIIFNPYNALQIQDILRQRASMAFKDNVIEAGTIEKCAAYSAREHGDARRALELLRVAGELSERENKKTVNIEQIDKAENKIERERVLDVVISQPKQVQSVLYSIIKIFEKKKNLIFTGEVYELYKDICNKVSLRPLTQRRVSDVIAELDMYGIINIRVISKGRYGRTREISLSIPENTIPKVTKILAEGLELT